MWRYLKWALGFWWGIGWSFAGILLTIVGIFTWSRYEMSADNFYQARATIADKKHIGRARDCYITVGYLARDGVAHQSDVLVARRDFDQYALGGSVDVYVSGGDPNDAWLTTDGPRTAILPIIVTVLAALFIIPGPIVFAISLFGAATRARVFSTGSPVTGEVVEVENSGWRINGIRWQSYRVRWTGTDGQTYETNSLPFAPKNVKYDKGDPITVFVDVAAPSRGEPDPDHLRQS